jgi:hypothetical protein
MPLFGHDAYVDDDDDDVDVDAYINTGCSKDQYMPRMDDDEEEVFRNHGDQPRRANVTQRLTFQGFSQEDTPDPEAGDPAQPKPAGTIFSPNTLHRTFEEVAAPPAPSAPPADQSKKKHRKRTKKGASASQPLPNKKIRAGADAVVIPSSDGEPRILHTAGKLIVSPEMERLATGPMLSLNGVIQMLEGLLLKDKCPNYPVFTAKVPEHPDFVHEDPADVFFIAFEDIFNLFHSRRLDYNLVRLYALSVQLKIQRESPPHVTVADPYYMRDSQLEEGSRTRTKAVKYLESFMLRNIEKRNILLPVFPE